MAGGTRTLSAALTGKECYVYRTWVWQRDPEKKNEWKNVAEETGHITFLIQDPTGELSVEPFGAELDLRQTYSREYPCPSSSEAGISERVAGFLKRNGVALDRPTCVEEACLEPAAQVFVSGTLTENLDKPNAAVGVTASKEDVTGKELASKDAGDALRELSHTEAAPNLAVLGRGPEIIRLASGSASTCTTQMTQQEKIAAALSRAGLARDDVWAAAENCAPCISSIVVAEERQPRAGAALQTATATPNPAASQAEDDAVLAPVPAPRLSFAKGATDSKFVISNRAEPDYPTLEYKAVALVVVGSGLSVFGLYFLLLGHGLPWLR